MVIEIFNGKSYFLRNFYICIVYYGGLEFDSSEAAY